MDTRYSPVIYTYLKQFQQDPSSRVFAPLAEAYRKAGLLDEAIEVAREGVERHPAFMAGKVALARALFDKHEYGEVIQLLSPIIRDAPDNLVGQRLLAESYLMTGRLAESLDAHKMLLYFNPHDAELAKVVFELEAQVYSNGILVLQESHMVEHPDNIRTQVSAMTGPTGDFDLWTRQLRVLNQLLKNIGRYRQY